MLRDAVWQLASAMSGPIFAAAIVAVAAAVAAGRRGPATVRLLFLPLVSYYVTFIAVVGYHYDRFLMGPIIILAVAVGWWLDRWLGRDRPMRGLRIAATCCAFGTHYRASRPLMR